MVVLGRFGIQEEVCHLIEMCLCVRYGGASMRRWFAMWCLE